MNPTRNLLPAVLAGAAETYFFGPGYVSRSELEVGLNRYLDRHGPFDFVLATEHITFAHLLSDSAAQKSYKNYVAYFDRGDIAHRCQLQQELEQIDLPRIAFLLESDYYNFPPSQIGHIAQKYDYFVAWGEQFFRPVEELEHLAKESFGTHANDNWLSFAQENRNKLISLMHFVGDDEFFFGGLGSRKADWSVPGTPYWARRAAKNSLPACSLSRPHRFPVAGLLSRMGLHPFGWPAFLEYYRQTFRTEIRNSRFSYTCGSALGYPIRKFFEIPALGAVLACHPCHAWEELGFVDGVNAFGCEPGDIRALDAKLKADPEYAQHVAREGQRLVLAQHSVSARARQLAAALTAIVEHRFGGSRWREGRFEIQTRSPVEPGACR